jgi:hypothetical protein
MPNQEDRGDIPAKARDMPTKLIIDLVKLYNDNNDKYGGELYDILDVKLQIFYECYNTIGLPED